MKPNYTHIRILIDRSGSMDHLKQEVINGIEKYIQEQATLPGDLTVDVIQFDYSYSSKEDGYQTLVSFANPRTNPVSLSSYEPRGMTALFDSWGKAIDELGESLSKMKEEDRPERVIFVTMTDGEENASQVFNSEQIKEKTKHQTDNYNWKFVYLGANQDAVVVGSSLGTSVGNNLTFDASAKGLAASFATLSTGTMHTRSVDLNAYKQAVVFAQN